MSRAGFGLPTVAANVARTQQAKGRAWGAFLVCLAIVLSGCASTGSTENPHKPIIVDSPSLALSKTLLALEAGVMRNIDVEALDAAGAPIPFAVESSADVCLDVDATSTTVEVTGTCPGQFDVVVPGTDLRRTVEVDVGNRMEMDIGDGLMISYTNTYQTVNPFKHGDVTVYRPVSTSKETSYTLGHVAMRAGTEPTTVAAVMARDDGNTGALAEPTGFSRVSNVKGTDWILQAECPAGYVALGHFTYYRGTAPRTQDVRCVAERFTIEGQLGDFVGWDPEDYGLGFWPVRGPSMLPASEGRIPLGVGSFLFCVGPDDHGAGEGEGKCRFSNLDAAHVLMVPIRTVERSDNTGIEPRLASAAVLASNVPRFQSEVRVPFTLLSDAIATEVPYNVAHSPFYTVYRTETYTTMGSAIDNVQGLRDLEYEYQVETGWSNEVSEEFSKTTGITVEATVGFNVYAVAVEVKAGFSRELGWSRTTSSSYEERVAQTFSYPVSPGSFVQIVQVTTTFIVVDATGVPRAELPAKSSNVKILEYHASLRA